MKPSFPGTTQLRSRIMSANKSRDTKPELQVRAALHRSGYRFRLHRRDLPGSPDIVLPRFKLAVFVHGCFWHGHHCKAKRPPKTNAAYWADKIAANIERDRRNVALLQEQGWQVCELFECSLEQGIAALIEQLQEVDRKRGIALSGSEIPEL